METANDTPTTAVSVQNREPRPVKATREGREGREAQECAHLGFLPIVLASIGLSIAQPILQLAGIVIMGESQEE